jgi:sporulation protein YlmC with PRC-barrel domain
MAQLDLVYEVLDMQLVDADGRRCGRVDDIELAGSPPVAVALLAGAGAQPDRLAGRRLRRLARRVTGPAVLGRNVIRVPWHEIDEIGSVVRLRRKADELDLGHLDAELRPLMRRLPGT